MSRWLYLLVLWPSLVWAAPPLDMLLPHTVERHPNGWRLLHYDPQTFEPGESQLVMLCLRAGNPIASAPMLHVVPESDTPRRDKLHLVVTHAGASAVMSGDLPPYVTYRVENIGPKAITVNLQVWIRRIE